MSTLPQDSKQAPADDPQEGQAQEPTIIAEQDREAPSGPTVIPADTDAQKVIDSGQSKM